jgi:pyruvate-formate lyase-activating enzyme
MAAAARHEALATVPSVHLAAMRAHDRKAVLVQREEGGRWQETPDWRLDRQVIRLGLYLRERAGLLPGHRVVIVSPPRRESLLADLTVMVQGAVAVALDPELPAPALAAALAKIAPHAAFVAGPPELKRVAEACPVLCGETRPHPAGRADVATGSGGAASSGRLVSFDAPAQGAALLSEVLDLGGTLDTAERAVAFRARAREVTAGQLALEYVDRSPDGSARSGAFTHGEVVAQLRAVWSEVTRRRRGSASRSCPAHGTFEDLLSLDQEFSRIIESRYYGRDFRTLEDEKVHRHGTSTIRHGRGAVLTIDLTNRCNMMCSPCFMDANQVGYVHELTLDEIKEILDDSISFKPRRQMSVQFSGGEPTMSPHFLDACRYAKETGYYSVQAATNGVRFALEPEFAHQAKEAGFDIAYLQFDGVTNEGNSHRHITNLFDVKAKAIESLHDADIDILPVTTVVNTVSDRQVGPILQFVMDNCDKMGGSVLGYKEKEQDWTVLWVGGMWFQDLWTYDFRRTEMCVIPYGTQEGEVSFCAYNTGVGWRQIVDAGDRPMPLAGESRLKLPVLGSGAGLPASGDRVRSVRRGRAPRPPEDSPGRAEGGASPGHADPGCRCATLTPRPAGDLAWCSSCWVPGNGAGRLERATGDGESGAGRAASRAVPPARGGGGVGARG